MSVLPKDVFKYLTESFLDGVDICTCMRVCYEWYFILKDSEKRRIHYVDELCPEITSEKSSVSYIITMWKKFGINVNNFNMNSSYDLIVKCFRDAFTYKYHSDCVYYIIKSGGGSVEIVQELCQLFPGLLTWKYYQDYRLLIKIKMFPFDLEIYGKFIEKEPPKKRLRSNDNYWKMKDFLEENNKKLKL